MWWFVLLLVVSIVFWIHYSRAMSVMDRISVAQDIMRSSNFTFADGFEAAVKEDPELIGWIQDKSDCVMLFRSEHGDDVHEIVDFASQSFHPGLVVHYVNSKAKRIDSTDIEDRKVRTSAEELLRKVRRAVEARLEATREYDGCHY